MTEDNLISHFFAFLSFIMSLWNNFCFGPVRILVCLVVLPYVLFCYVNFLSSSVLVSLIVYSACSVSLHLCPVIVFRTSCVYRSVFGQCLLPTDLDKSLVAWVQIDLKCPSKIFLINIFYKKWLILIPKAFGIMFWCKTKLLKSILTFIACKAHWVNFCKDKSLVALSYDAPNPKLELHLWPIIDQSIIGCV